MITCAVWELLDLLDGYYAEGTVAVLLVFFLHLSVWVSILTLGNLLWERQLTPCILLVVEGMLYVLSANYDQPLLACGMYVRCNCAKTGVATIIYGVEVLIITGCYFIAPQLWKGGYLERKVI